jgi:hypothetical protein
MRIELVELKEDLNSKSTNPTDSEDAQNIAFYEDDDQNIFSEILEVQFQSPIG